MENAFDNVIEQSELKTNLENAFLSLDRILVDHSGPFATNCVIGSKWRQVNDVDEFTKDGIKILRHLLVSDDVSARFAARMARFVGFAVDKRCHDGTTTSMLLFCRLAIAALSKLDTPFLNPERYLWSKSLTNALTACMAYLEDLKITEDDIFLRCKKFGIETTINDVRASVAYHMAMISSKGDHGLSDKVAHVIRSSPKKILGMFRDIPLAVETEEPYILKKQEFDLSINANLGNIRDYNHRNDTQYLSENAVLFVTGNEITAETMESTFLNAFISRDARLRSGLFEFGDTKGWEAFHEKKRNLIILSPLVNDPTLIATIIEFNMKNPECPISWFNLQVNGRMRTSLNKTLHYMAGVPIFTDVMSSNPTASFIGLGETPAKAHLIGHVLTLSHLYERDGEVFHPLYRNPDLFPDYTRFANETEELIIFANENITNQALDHDEVTYLTSLYRALTTQDIYDIEIGGSTHDQYANRTVYEDAIGAALSAVNEGVVLGGYGHLAYIFQSALTLDDSGNKEINDLFHQVFLSIVEDSLRHDQTDDTVSNLTKGLDNKWSYIVADMNKYTSNSKPGNYILSSELDKETLEKFLQRNPEETILLQAYAGYHEQFRRCRDILPRLSNTTHLCDMRIKEGEDVR